MAEYQIDANVLDRLKHKYKIFVNKTDETSTVKEVPAVRGFSKAAETKPQKSKCPEKIVADCVSETTTKEDTKSKNVVVFIDPDIVSKSGIQLTFALEAMQIKYELQVQVIPNTITWLHAGTLSTQVAEDEVILLMYWDEVLKLVETNSLTNHVRTLREISPRKNIYLGLYGFENYCIFRKLKKTYQQNENLKVNQKKLVNYATSSRISKYELELALTEVQLMSGCCHRFLETSEDLSDMIVQYTKSIMQAPQKLKSRDKYKDFEWYVPKDNRDCVHVDKIGNGLQRLWQQQLTMFESVRLETAQAIISMYPTPASLFNAYRKCSKSEGRKLVENLPVRRAAGPLTTSRKIGLELSNKLYNFFNTIDGDCVI